ncbi:MAG TPA: hypothetical protein IGR89_12780 [Oscillatoriaceae cyanobacterium M7585_C2015_266]|nr:hypothetical protein [Oscillatoriaceae cyanobacterium M7585_C2015_266]
MLSKSVYSLTLKSLLPIVATLAVLLPAITKAQTPNLPADNQPPESPGSEEKTAQPQAPEEIRSIIINNSILSVQGGKRLMQEAENAISSQNYTLAISKLQEARQVFNQLSNFYQDLSASFAGIDNRIADSLRRQALETAQMRDQATYQLALVHRAQNQPELAVPLLVQIIRSQQPTRDLGKKAYQQLFELGFVDSPYPRARSGSSSDSSRAQPSASERSSSLEK